MAVATTLAGAYVPEVAPSGVAAVVSMSPSVQACGLPELRVLRHKVWRNGVGKWAGAGERAAGAQHDGMRVGDGRGAVCGRRGVCAAAEMTVRVVAMTALLVGDMPGPAFLVCLWGVMAGR